MKRITIFLIIPLFLASCGAEAGPKNEVCTQELGIGASPRAVTIHPGESARLKAEIITCGGKYRDVPPDLEWSSEDPKVAVAEPPGRVRGVSQGSTRVLATSEKYGVTWRFEVRVVNR